MPFIASNGLTEAGTSKTIQAGGMTVQLCNALDAQDFDVVTGSIPRNPIARRVPLSVLFTIALAATSFAQREYPINAI